MIEHVILIGRIETMESAIASTMTHCKTLTRFARVEDLGETIDTWPDLVVVLQHSPDEYSKRQIESLLARFAVSRVLCCYGPWCASMGRTRAYWSPAVTVPLAEFEHRLKLEHDVILGKRPALPITAGLDEVFGFNASVDRC